MQFVESVSNSFFMCERKMEKFSSFFYASIVKIYLGLYHAPSCVCAQKRIIKTVSFRNTSSLALSQHSKEYRNQGEANSGPVVQEITWINRETVEQCRHIKRLLTLPSKLPTEFWSTLPTWINEGWPAEEEKTCVSLKKQSNSDQYKHERLKLV